MTALRVSVLAAFLVAIGLVFPAHRAQAAFNFIDVTTTLDELDALPDATCSLREAIRSANTSTAVGGCPAGSPADIEVIRLSAGVYTLTRAGADDTAVLGDLDILANLFVLGPGMSRPSGLEAPLERTSMGAAVIDGGGIDRVFHVISILRLRGVTVRNGVASDIGGGIRNEGFLGLGGVTLTDNEAGSFGGAIANRSSMELGGVTISGNRAVTDGGGIDNAGGGTATLNNVTIANNRADSDGNGGGDGGGIKIFSGTVTVRNTILGGNTDPVGTSYPDCSGTLTSDGYNIIQSTAGCTVDGDTTGNKTGVDPKVGQLRDNGGPTPTHMLRPGSPAIDSGQPGRPLPVGRCDELDQRGIDRTLGGRCDVGAIERVKCFGRPVKVVGSLGRDRIVGTGAADAVLALDGRDVVRVRGGKDRVCAGEGRDRVFGGRGGDKLRGEAGGDLLDGQRGTDLCVGGGGRDRARHCERTREIP